ncbi:hypothetical protein JW960_06635 [candidate division KSB1 bacterium]|nr:hypothetical protein [candidate division KSB1 bacterium]
MERKTFIKCGCAYGLLSLINASGFAGQTNDQQQSEKKHTAQSMSQKQVQEVIKFIETSFDDSVREKIFSQLGYECFHSRSLDGWIVRYVGHVQAFLDWVNVEKKSKYWERLEFNEDRTILSLTGRKVAGCACAYADCLNPPKSLCYYCCKNFQQQLFGMLLGQRVNVEITKAFLLGDDRCDTRIHLM